MSCITKILELKGDKEFLPLSNNSVVIEGGGKYKGFEFIITFTCYGTRCGYVAIPHETKYYIYEINVHGGVTFESKQHIAKNLLTVPCNDIWIGFDAAHWGDMRDFDLAKHYFSADEDVHKKIELMECLHKDIDKLECQYHDFSHKTYNYMVDQCKYVIEQLMDQAA